MVFFFVSFISAAPPFQSGVFDNGYEIKIPPISIIKQNTDTNFNFHVFNISNGLPIDNSSTDCFLHIYNSSGEQVALEIPHIESNIPNEWEFRVLGGNFSSVGFGGYIIQCNSSLLGGFTSNDYLITGLGTEPTTTQAIMYSSVLFIFIILFLGSFIWFLNIPWEHYTSNEGDIIQVNTERTKKVIMFFVSYILLLFFFFVGKSMSENLMFINDIAAFFNTFFWIFLVALAPVAICIMAIIIITTLADRKLHDWILRGTNI